MNRRPISKRFAFSATTAVALTFVVCCAAALVWPVSASRHAGTQAAPAAASNLRGAALRNSDGGSSNAATPAGGTLSPSNRTVIYAGGPFTVPTNSTDSAGGPVTCDQAHPCEDYNLTIDIPQSYKDTHPTDVVKIVIAWDDPTGQQDLDAFLVNNPDDGNYPAHADNGGSEPETVVFPMSKITAGAHNYFVRVVPFISTGQAYIGYLRRNPNDAPDGDFSGYNFWLSKLNSFSQPGDDVRDDSVAQRRAQRAEMVRAFIESAEYRERFAGGANRGEQQGALAQARPASGDAAPSALVEALLATRMIRMP